MREEGRRRFAHEVATRVDGLRDAIENVKHEMLAKGTPLRSLLSTSDRQVDGLQKVFSMIKSTPDVRNLSDDYKAVLEWGKITSVEPAFALCTCADSTRSLASTIFQTFIASDSGSETLSNLKRIHGMIPYYVLKGILKMANPVGMIRSACMTHPLALVV